MEADRQRAGTPFPAAADRRDTVVGRRLRTHGGRFWLVVTNVGAGGNVLLTATDPAGPWSDPLPLPGVEGIDPDLAWDADGNCWCTVAGVSQYRIDPSTGETSGPPVRLWSGEPGAKAPEAPHLHHVGEHWYLLIAEGGTERGHAVSVARASSPNGPFEPCPANPVLSHRGTDSPVQNTGHADLVQAHDGTWWMVFLGVRPGGGTPGWHVLGRETFLAPVTWVGGWPVVGEIVSGPAPAVSERDEFDGWGLDPSWISLRDRSAKHCTTEERPGWLTLHARGAGMDDPAVVFAGRRQRHLSCVARTLVDTTDGSGGLAVRMDEEHHYEIEAGAGEVRVIARIGPLRAVVASRPVQDGPVVLVMRVRTRTPRDARSGPDTVSFGVEEPEFRELASLDGKYLSTEVAGGFTGRVIGLYAATGTVRFDWFEYQAPA